MVGAGVMGSEIGDVASLAGHRVPLVDTDATAPAVDGPAPGGPLAPGDLTLEALESVQSDLERPSGSRFDDVGTTAEQFAAGRLRPKSGRGCEADGSDGVPPDSAAAAVDETRRCRGEGVDRAEEIDVAMRLGAGGELGPLALVGEVA